MGEMEERGMGCTVGLGQREVKGTRVAQETRLSVDPVKTQESEDENLSVAGRCT